jgi:16S rRNA processing protein RimM
MIEIGTIVNTHGLRGDLKIRSESDFKAQRFAVGATLWINNEPFTVVMFRSQKGFDVVHFKGVDSIESATALKNQTLYAPLEEGLLEEGEYHTSQLVGCQVVEAGVPLGVVDAVRHYPAHPVLVVNKTLMIPFVDAFIDKVDLSTNTIHVTLIEGMR